VYDQIRVHGAVIPPSIGSRGITYPRKPSVAARTNATQSACRSNHLHCATSSTLQMKLRCARGQHGGRDHDSRYTHELVHRLSGQLAELSEVESRSNGDLNFGNRVGGCGCFIGVCQGEEDGTGGASRGILKLFACKSVELWKDFKFHTRGRISDGRS
jgi:hypothetical protein